LRSASERRLYLGGNNSPPIPSIKGYQEKRKNVKGPEAVSEENRIPCRAALFERGPALWNGGKSHPWIQKGGRVG